MTTLELITPHASKGQSTEQQLFAYDLISLAGGYSEYEGKGVWRDANGRLYSEPHTRYVVATEDEAAVIERFEKWGRRAGEKSIYYTVNGASKLLALEVV